MISSSYIFAFDRCDVCVLAYSLPSSFRHCSSMCFLWPNASILVIPNPHMIISNDNIVFGPAFYQEVVHFNHRISKVNHMSNCETARSIIERRDLLVCMILNCQQPRTSSGSDVSLCNCPFVTLYSILYVVPVLEGRDNTCLPYAACVCCCAP